MFPAYEGQNQNSTGVSNTQNFYSLDANGVCEVGQWPPPPSETEPFGIVAEPFNFTVTLDNGDLFQIVGSLNLNSSGECSFGGGWPLSIQYVGNTVNGGANSQEDTVPIDVYYNVACNESLGGTDGFSGSFSPDISPGSSAQLTWMTGSAQNSFGPFSAPNASNQSGSWTTSAGGVIPIEGSFQAVFGAGSAVGSYILIFGAQAPPPTSPKISINTNDNCNKKIGIDCSANIVLADGLEQTVLYFSVSPPKVFTISSTATFGSVASVTTLADGDGQGAYTPGNLLFGDTDTTAASVTASNRASEAATIFNYDGFNFHESQVSDSSFRDVSTMSTSEIQTFLSDQESFLARFIFVGTTQGFEDLNGNGVLDPGEPIYSATGKPLKPGAKETSAATIIHQSAVLHKINPEVLIATAEKENSLVSSDTLPSASVLNFGMGCHKPNTFKRQIACAAITLVNRFNDKKAFGRIVRYPFFFHSGDGIQHYVTDYSDREAVGFSVNTAATYA